MLRYCAAVVSHYDEKRKTISQDNRWDNGREECAAGGKWSTSMKDGNAAWRISSAANSPECNTSCSVVWKQAMGGPGPLEPTAPAANAYLYYHQKGILFPSDDYSATPAVLFIWLRAQTICIDSLFIHCWTRHCVYECRRNGPNYGERCLPATPWQSAMMKVSNWEEKSNQRPLVVFCKFKNPNMENIPRCGGRRFTFVADEIRRPSSPIGGSNFFLLPKPFQRPSQRLSALWLLNDLSMYRRQYIRFLATELFVISTTNVCFSVYHNSTWNLKKQKWPTFYRRHKTWEHWVIKNNSIFWGGRVLQKVLHTVLQ